MPANNRDYWTDKIERNVARDKRTYEALIVIGWEYRIVWECELRKGLRDLLIELETLKAQRA